MSPLSGTAPAAVATRAPVRSIAHPARWTPGAIAVVLGLAACGSSTGSTSSASTSSSSTSSSSASSASTSSAASSSSSTSTASPGSGGPQATPAIVSAATAFLAKLSSSEKATVLFARGDKTQKQRWSNLPTGLYQRKGLAVGDLSADKVNAFLAIMKATLSTEGYNRVMAEWSADDALAASSSSGGGPALNYGKKYYYVALIGEPSATQSWQWQFGGHHVTVNATIHGNDLSLTPSFIGAQPAKYTSSSHTVRPLGDIEDEAFALVGSLTSAQKAKAVLGSSYIDLVLGPGQDCKTIQAEGLAGSEMSSTQRAAFLHLINHYGGLANAEDAASREAQLKADLAKTTFAWYGPTAAGSASYFRVTGPHLVIEYSPQSMGGSATNHIHGMYRDPTNDYGGTVC